MDAKQLAQGWVDFWTQRAATGEFPDSDGNDVVDDLARGNPAETLNVILEILKIIEVNPENSHFQVLAAGPVEDLLGNHGPSMIDNVEREARQNPAFRLLLGGVWKGRMSADIWERIQNSRAAAW